MAANPQDFAYYYRGESPPANKGSGGTGGFDYFSRGEAFPAAIPASGAVTHNAAAALSGAGALSATATQTHVAATVISGTGALSAAATRTTFGAATLTGSGDLAATGARTTFGAATLTGAGDLAAAASQTHVAACAAEGTGSLSCAATVIPATPPAPATTVPPGQVAGASAHHELGRARLETVRVHWDTSYEVAQPAPVVAKWDIRWSTWSTVRKESESRWHLPYVVTKNSEAAWLLPHLVANDGADEYRTHDPDEHELLLYLMAAR